MRVKRGTIHALIGPNGAGKTTCFNLLTKFLTPSRGRITYNGHDITAMAPADVARLGLVRSFQISAVFPHLTALENVRVALQRQHGGSFDFWRSKSVLDDYNERAHATPRRCRRALVRRHRRAVEMPYGRKRALEIATTLALDPEMMLLDEPMAGMGHEDIDRVAALIKRMSANHTILMVEHNLSVVANLSDSDHRADARAGAGRRQLRRRSPTIRDVQEAYLGAGHDMTRPSRGAAAGRPGLAGLVRRDRHILHGIDFDVRAGEVVTLLGRNGAGKTTTLKSIMGIIGKRTRLASASRATRSSALASDKIARLGIALLSRGARHLREPRRARKPAAAAAGAAGGLVARADLRAVSEPQGAPGQSGHEAFGRRAADAGDRAASCERARGFLMLDEPTEGLAPVIIQQIGRTIRSLKEQGFTILLVEQNFRFAATVADRFYVIEHGKHHRHVRESRARSRTWASCTRISVFEHVLHHFSSTKGEI